MARRKTLRSIVSQHDRDALRVPLFELGYCLRLLGITASRFYLYQHEPGLNVPMDDQQSQPTAYRHVSTYGWPFDAWLECELVSSPKKEYRWSIVGFAADIAIGLAIVFGGAAACEYVVQGRVKGTVS